MPPAQTEPVSSCSIKHALTILTKYSTQSQNLFFKKVSVAMPQDRVKNQAWSILLRNVHTQTSGMDTSKMISPAVAVKVWRGVKAVA